MPQLSLLEAVHSSRCADQFPLAHDLPSAFWKCICTRSISSDRLTAPDLLPVQIGDILDVLTLRYSIAFGFAIIALVATPTTHLPLAAGAAVLALAPIPEQVSVPSQNMEAYAARASRT